MKKISNFFKNFFKAKTVEAEVAVPDDGDEVVAALTDADDKIIVKITKNGNLHVKGDVVAFSKLFENE